MKDKATVIPEGCENLPADGRQPSRVERVALRAFRNYRTLDLDLCPRIHIVAGENAQGKTNLLEALYLASTTRLLRGVRDFEAILDGEERANVEVALCPSGTQLRVVLERGMRKRVTVNGMGLPRASDVLGRLPTVCISTLDLPVVSGEPADRRSFLDLELSQLYPAYLKHLAGYKRALEQRNALLRAARDSHRMGEVFEPWEVQMGQHGARIREIRSRYLSELTPYAQAAHAHMGAGERLFLAYLPKDPAQEADALVRALAETRSADIDRGSTGIGPHRDDFLIETAGREARLYGSQGQQRTAMLGIKLGSMELEKGERGEPPLLLMDDILSDLDEGRRSRLLDWVLANAGQTLLTCTEPGAAGPAVLATARILHVEHGAVSG